MAFGKTYSLSEKRGQDYFCDPVFRITSPDVITSSDVQIHPLRIDIDLSRFVVVGREFFHRSRIFLDAAVAKCPAAGQDLEWKKCPVRELGHTIKYYKIGNIYAYIGS